MTAIKSAALVIVGAIIGIVLAAVTLGGEESVGGIYNQATGNFPGLNITGPKGANATTSSVFAKPCWTITTSTGGTVYWFANAQGSLATSSTSCN